LFLPDRTDTEKKEFLTQWDSMDFNEKNKITLSDVKWRLKNWIYHFEKNNRGFFIENIEVRENDIQIAVASKDLPVIIGPIEWLVRASGGNEFKEVD